MATNSSSPRPGPKHPFPTADVVRQAGTQAILPVAPKRIIICCDGTWQSSVTGLKNIPSNITRLTRSIARSGKSDDGQIWQQLVYYDAGIATGDISDDERDRQGNFGIGFVGNIIEAYNFIVLNYNSGDEILCFGFSRGAYTARAVAGLVTDIGVIAPRDLQDFPELFKVYQNHKDGISFRKSEEYRRWVNGVLAKDTDQPKDGKTPPKYWAQRPHSDAPESSRVVQVVGVFDTVGALGIPDLPLTKWNLKFLKGVWGIPQPGFHNVEISHYVKNAFQALALDEHRGPFSPAVWHFPEDDLTDKNKDQSVTDLEQQWEKVHKNPKSSDAELNAAWSTLIDKQMALHLKEIKTNLQQVWFPGVHVNSGGGSDELLKTKKGDFEQIALITFGWMCEQVRPFLGFVDDGTLTTLASNSVEDRYQLIRPALEELDFGEHWIMKHAWKFLNDHHVVQAHPKKIAHDVIDGWATGPITELNKLLNIAMSEYRTPGQYHKNAKGKTVTGVTNEWIHPSVRFRMDKLNGKGNVPVYLPQALVGFQRGNKVDAAGNIIGYQWTKGNVTIPEYVIKPEHKFSRYLALQDHDREDGDTAWAFIGGIDKLVGNGNTPEAMSVKN